MTAVAAPTGAILGDSDVQNITGGKTFFDQIFKRRNPANTFTLTQRNPIITADADTYVNQVYKYHIFKVGSTYYAQNQETQAVEFSGATLDPVLTSVLSAITLASTSQFVTPGGGDVYIDGGSHTLSGSFAGWTLPTLCNVTLASNCIIRVPNGYTGYVFKFVPLASPATSAGQLTKVEGGYFTEVGTPALDWTCFLFAPDSANGICFCSVKHTTVNHAKRAVHLRVDHASGWCNVCLFEDIKINGCEVGIEFDYNGFTPNSSLNGFHRNMFRDVVGQSDANVLYGFKNIHGTNNYFEDCQISDLLTYNPSGISANITSDATNTFIFGGSMTGSNFADLGVGTFVFDNILGYVHKANAASNAAVPETIGPVRITGLALQTPIISPSTAAVNSTITLKQYNNTSFSIDFAPFADSTSNTFSWWNTSLNERFYIQRAASGGGYLFDSVKQVAGGALRVIAFRMVDVVGATTVEAFRIQTDASMKFSTFHEHAVVTAPANPAASLVRTYAKQVDANNDGLFYKAKINGAVVEVQQ